jgi:hypothetical protein
VASFCNEASDPEALETAEAGGASRAEGTQVDLGILSQVRRDISNRDSSRVNQESFMSKKKSMTQAEHLALLEAQLRKPDLPAKTAAAVSRRISLLKGQEQPYAGAGGMQSAARQRQQRKAAEEAAQERQRKEAVGELTESQCQVRLFYAICDTVSEPDFDGLPITANPNPKDAQMRAINQKWISLSDDVRSKIQALAIERMQRKPLSGTDEVRFLDRAERLMSNQPEPISEPIPWQAQQPETPALGE